MNYDWWWWWPNTNIDGYSIACARYLEYRWMVLLRGASQKMTAFAILTIVYLVEQLTVIGAVVSHDNRHWWDDLLGYWCWNARRIAGTVWMQANVIYQHSVQQQHLEICYRKFWFLDSCMIKLVRFNVIKQIKYTKCMIKWNEIIEFNFY